MILFLIISCICVFIVYSAIVVGDERRYLDTYEGELKVYTIYNSDKVDAHADFSMYEATGRINLYVWSRQRAPQTRNPHVQVFPHGTVRISKEGGKVYDWYVND